MFWQGYFAALLRVTWFYEIRFAVGLSAYAGIGLKLMGNLGKNGIDGTVRE